MKYKYLKFKNKNYVIAKNRNVKEYKQKGELK